MTLRTEFHPQGRWLPAPSLTLAALLLVFAVSSALAIEPAQVPDDKRSATGLHLTAVEAAAMKRADPAKVLLIDVRSRAEGIHRHRYFGVLAPNSPLRAAVTAHHAPCRHQANTRSHRGGVRAAPHHPGTGASTLGRM